MELVTLDSNFQPERLVENYESLIWAERYSKNGDFELRSSDIAAVSKLLPRESLVTLRDSTVPMMVETHKIVKPLRERPQIHIFGRTFETVLDRRGSVNVLPPADVREPWEIDATKESDALYLALRDVLGDSERATGFGLPSLPARTPAISELDAIPELNLHMPGDYIHIAGAAAWLSTTNYVPGHRVRHLGYVWHAKAVSLNVAPSLENSDKWLRIGPWQSYEIKPQNLYKTVTEMLEASRHGIKSVRPTVDETQIDVEIYNGANLTGEGETGDPDDVVVIDVRFDQIDDATYLLSNQGSTNVGYVYGKNIAGIVHKNTYANPGDEPSGLARRVLVVDESSTEEVNSQEILRSRGLIELYQHNATALFDGEVAQQIAAGYNRDYFLGDIVKLVGEYGLSQNARVAEFIRSEDASGEKAFPTFEAVDD